MPEDKSKKTVDIDTSGPEVDVEFEDTAKPEPEFEVKESNVKEVEKEEKPLAASSEKLETSSEKPEAKKDELEDYSEGVQRRIAKLTKKMREAERQREEALRYAQTVKAEKELLTKRFSSLETTSLKDKEAKIISALEAAKGKLGLAREAGDLAIEIEAQKEIAKLAEENPDLDLNQIQPQYIGEVWMSQPLPWFVLHEPAVRWQDVKYVFRGTLKHIEQVEKENPSLSINQEALKEDNPERLSALGPQFVFGKWVIEWEFYHIPTPFVPKGYYCRFIDKKILRCVIVPLNAVEISSTVTVEGLAADCETVIAAAILKKVCQIYNNMF